jgi:hypothetical protein
MGMSAQVRAPGNPDPVRDVPVGGVLEVDGTPAVVEHPSVPHAAYRAPALARHVLVVLFACFAAAGCWALTKRGPWLDEFWTVWQAQHDLPIDEILVGRWMADFNPPLFSLMHWALAPLLGVSIEAHRLVNVFALGWAAAFVSMAMKRYPQRSAFIVVYATLVLCLPATSSYFAEARSYFAQISVYFVLTMGLVLIAQAQADLDWKRDKLFAAMPMVSAAFAINLHYISTLLACLLLTGFVASLYMRGRRRWAWVLAGVTVASLVPLVWYLYAQLPFLLDSSMHYWVRGTIGVATLRIGFMAIDVIRSNPVVSMAAAIVAALTWSRRDTIAAAHRPLTLSPDRKHVTALLAAVLCTFSAAMLVAQLRQPIVTARYLLNFQVITLALLAFVAAEALMRWRWWFAVSAMSAALAIVLHARGLASEERWDASVREVVRLVHACPESSVYAVVVLRPSFSINEIAVLRWAYRKQAADYGIARYAYRVNSEPAIVPAGSCPSVFWVEHVDWEEVGRDASIEELAQLIGLVPSNVAIDRAKLFVTDTGFVLSLPAR